MPIRRESHIWERDPHDWYVEPQRATHQLLVAEFMEFGATIYDPACGQGNVVAAARACGFRAFGRDLVDRVSRLPGGPPPWFLGTEDFTGDAGVSADPDWSIVTNPPYFGGRGAEDFIRRALAHTRKKTCVFVALPFVAGERRAAGLFREHPPHRIWIVTPRPSCPPGGVLASGLKAEGDRKDYCWLVWDAEEAYTGMLTGWLRGRDAA